MDIPIADYDGADDPTNGEIQTRNQAPNKYRLAVEDTPALNAVKVATRQEEEIVVAQPIVVEADRSKAGSKRRSQMQVVSIRLDSDSDSSNGRKLSAKFWDFFCSIIVCIWVSLLLVNPVCSWLYCQEEGFQTLIY